MLLRKSLLLRGLNLLFYHLWRHHLTRVSPTQPVTECGLNGRHLWREVGWLPRRFAVRDAFVSCQFVVVSVKLLWKWKRLQTLFYRAHLSLAEPVNRCKNTFLRPLPWQPMDQNPLDVIYKWTWITCVVLKSFFLYSVNESATLTIVNILPTLSQSLSTTYFWNYFLIQHSLQCGTIKKVRYKTNLHIKNISK